VSDNKKFLWIVAFFLVFYFVPEGHGRVNMGVTEAVWMRRDYAREHVLLCLVPAFFIAGGISVFVSQESVLKYLGAAAGPLVAYSVAGVSGGILAVCSCTVMPLFAGIYMRGAGLGPAITFLFSGPAINVLSMILTARVLGLSMGVARTASAVSFSIILGLLMAFIFKKEDQERLNTFTSAPPEEDGIPAWKASLHVGSMVLLLIFANWAAPKTDNELWQCLYSIKWKAALFFLAVVMLSSVLLFNKEQRNAWLRSTWDYTLMVTPLLFGGVLLAGFFLGRPGHEALIPSEWVASLVGGNSIAANFSVAILGTMMYFATLTEVPILQGLMGSGMGTGPALTLLLVGPSISLPSILIISSVLGWKKTLTYTALMIILSSVVGVSYGTFF
jgi:uncharacterized membrane protein YraQ (UPF0718 family)